MATFAQILASATKWINAGDKAHAIVNGPATGAGSTVVVESGTLPTFAKKLADFQGTPASNVLPIYDASGPTNLPPTTGVPTGAIALVPDNAPGDKLIYYSGSSWLSVSTGNTPAAGL